MKSETTSRKNTFQFKCFALAFDRCAMKITADAVLFGAWIESIDASRILDIGSGTGLLSLMAAQTHPEAAIIGIELDPVAAEQGAQNAAFSSYSDRILIEYADAAVYTVERPVDLVISNPPFFERGSLSPDKRRRNARSEEKLNLRTLVDATIRNMSHDGSFATMWPVRRFDELDRVCGEFGLYLHRKTVVHPRNGQSAHIVFSQWGHGRQTKKENALVLRDSRGITPEYERMVAPFYPDIGRLK